MTIHVQIFVWKYVFISLACIPRSGIASSWAMFKLLRNWQFVFHRGCIDFQFFHALINAFYCHTRYMSGRNATLPSGECEVVFHVALSRISRVASDLRASFHELIGHSYIFFGGMSIQILCPFLNWVVFFLLNCKNSKYIYISQFLIHIRQF